MENNYNIADNYDFKIYMKYSIHKLNLVMQKCLGKGIVIIGEIRHEYLGACRRTNYFKITSASLNTFHYEI